MRGAERTFAAIAELYPQAPIFTLLYDEQGTGGRFADRTIVTSPLQRLGVRQEIVQAPAAALPVCGRAAAAAAVRARAEQQQRLRARRARARRRRARLLLPRPVSLRLVRASARARPRCRRRCGRCLRLQLARMRRWDLAASRARRRLHRQLRAHARADRALLRPRRDDHPPARRDAPLRPRASPATLCWSSPSSCAHKRVRVALEAARLAHAPIRVVGSGPDHDALRAGLPRGRVPRARRGRAAGCGSTRARARCSYRAWRSSGSPPSRRRRPDGR